MIIDQRWLPHELRIVTLRTVDDVAVAIRDMWVRGAPLIGVTAAYGVAVAMAADPSDAHLETTPGTVLNATRPTAINLRWALNEMRAPAGPDGPRPSAPPPPPPTRRRDLPTRMWRSTAAIGRNGLAVIRDIASPQEAGRAGQHPHPLQRRLARDGRLGHRHLADLPRGRSRHRRPRLGRRNPAAQPGRPAHGVGAERPRRAAFTLIVDNAGGHLMQHGQVDMVIVGTDRTTAHGDVCNKIGTYLKALAAQANGVPFYVALPSPTIDWTVNDGVKEIPIEERSGTEVTHVQGRDAAGRIVQVQISPDGTPGVNPAFDVTPHHLITGLITERGIAPATAAGLKAMFPDRA